MARTISIGCQDFETLKENKEKKSYGAEQQMLSSLCCNLK